MSATSFSIIRLSFSPASTNGPSSLIARHSFLYSFLSSFFKALLPGKVLHPLSIASQGAFGAIPIFTGTLLITLVAMFVAIPVGLLSAIYLSEYARPSVRKVLKPLLEILAGIPTVVYGFFAAITVGPFLKDFAQHFGFSVASESALAAGGVMGIMIIPFISSLSDDVINAVPMSLRDGSYAMGATKSETIKKAPQLLLQKNHKLPSEFQPKFLTKVLRLFLHLVAHTLKDRWLIITQRV